jgi:hypothetical protein
MTEREVVLMTWGAGMGTAGERSFGVSRHYFGLVVNGEEGYVFMRGICCALFLCNASVIGVIMVMWCFL